MYAGKRCPEVPEHGTVLPWTASSKYGWHCPNQAHDGKPRTTKPSRAFFTTAEVESGKVADAK